MTAQLIAIDATALDTLISEMRELREEVRQARIAPEPRWITLSEYAAKVGKSEATVRRWKNEGRIEMRNGLFLNPAI